MGRFDCNSIFSQKCSSTETLYKSIIWGPTCDALDMIIQDFMLPELAANTAVSSTNKTDRYDIAEILLKVALNTKTLTITTFVLKAISVNIHVLILSC
jgi:hypothetical protein